MDELLVPDYHRSSISGYHRVLSFFVGALISFFVVNLFYRVIFLGILFGILGGVVNVHLSSHREKQRRKQRLRSEFLQLLQTLLVSLSSGNPMAIALEDANNDLTLILGENSDIVKEVQLILGKFKNSVSLSESFYDFSKRCGLEDVESFATIYQATQGKSDRDDEIVRETQEILRDKIEIEMEIETLLTASKQEGYIMLFTPLMILGIISGTGATFMDSIYTTPIGRLVATFSLGILVFSYFMIEKLTKVKV